MPDCPDTSFSPGIFVKRISPAIFFLFFLLYNFPTYGQQALPVKGSVSSNSTGSVAQLFNAQQSFIKNINQYGMTVEGHENMGMILYGYEGLGMPVLFTPKGLIHLQRKIEKISHEEEERLEKQGLSEEEIENKKNVTDKVITMEWLGANPGVEIIPGEMETAYHTYGTLQRNAPGYKKLTYRNIYPGIDIVYTFSNTTKSGFEYSLVVHPGADISVVKMKFGGDIKSIRKDSKGNLLVRSEIEGISQTIPISYYGEELITKTNSEVKSGYTIDDNQVGFSFPQSYDHTKTMVIDPFITNTGNLTGLNAGKAKDVDFDYAGNVYVTGGGTGASTHQLAKFNSAGALQWTFNGTLTIPSWTFGTYWGGWMVEKPTGNVYLGQGFNPATGFQVIRVSTTGLYDNFITTANPNFREAWKMYWSCNNGAPQILVAGGGTNSNINFGVFAPPSTAIGSLNVTGIAYTGTAGWAQDIVDFIIDPANNDMYTIYGSLIGNPSLTNKIYKNTAPYSGASVAWNVPSGFTSVQEIANRPYLIGGQIDNSANIFAINGSYLYYWDGKNLKAFDKATGAGVGTPLVTANTLLMQGGIIADACNNVFVGEGNGLIKVYKFNGSVFDDAAAPDITIPGFPGKSVYDLAYDESKKLLYASGDGFVASFDVSAYCPTTQYTLNVVPDCLTASATVSVTPTPPPGSTVTYVLSAGGTQIATNTTGIFTGLSPNITYTVVATINLACSGTQATTTFVLPGPVIALSSTNTTCGNSTGTITATGSGTAAPYAYSIDGTNFQASGAFTGLTAGVYTVTVKDANGCSSSKTVTILNTNGPVLTFTSTNADCGNNNGTITANATGGVIPYQYSINSVTYQSGNFFTGLVGGTYTLTVKDANGCINATIVNITSSPAPQILAIPASATCGSNNGTITAFGSSGTAPLQYSINGNIFQASTVFTNLTPGAYTVTVKDVNGCINTTTVTIANSPAPTVTAVSTAAACNNINGSITATGNGGIAPLQYSINGTIFQTSNIFTGLAPGSYTITVQDATGCTNITTVAVASTNGPVVTAVSTVSVCSANTGSITATAGAGTPPYQYSINGSIFQVSNLFTALAAGNYVVYVKDAAGCISTAIVGVGNTAGPSLTIVSTATACNSNNGTITATGSGGAAPLQYSIDGITYQAGNVFNGLATGTYTIYVKDANGCIKTVNTTITNVSGLSLAVSTISSSCNINSGTITATATGGIGALQYSIDGVTYQAGNIFTGLAAGLYTVYVKDANGCIVTKQAVVTSVAGPSLTVTVQQNATCGTASGVIRATSTGGVAPITYSIDGGAFQSIPIFINVAPGIHTVTVKDAAGCTVTQSVTITNASAGTAITDVTFNVKDALACTGHLGKIKNLKGAPNGGGNTYTFSLDGGAFTAANQFTNVGIGVHTITAKNQNGCTITKLVTIGDGVPATATAVATATACNTSNGTITITGVGANTPYHASIDNGATWVTFFPPGANSFTFTGLAPGTYSIIIADDADFTTGPPDIPGACLTTIFVVVPSTGGPSIATTQIPGTCTSSNGSITASGSGGTPPYTYNINGGTYFPSGVFNNLVPGTYAVTVMDATGCITGSNVTLANPSVPSLTAIVQSNSCDLNNGSITATATGGVAPLEYSVNGTTFQISNSFTNLAPGNYILYVKDVNGCYSSIPVTIINTPLPKVTAFTIAATCNNNDGSIVATGSFGEAPYTFSLDGIVYQSSPGFSNLAAGFYTVFIKDARGCITTTGVSVENTTAPTIANTTITPATCDNATGSIDITATGGVSPLQYSIDGINFQAGNIFTALLPGSYTVIVKDANGCFATKTISIANTNGPQVLTATVINAACASNNGSISATASGGTAPFQYSIDGISYQASAIFNNVAAANYTLYVKDINGCIKTLPVTVLNLPGPVLTATSSPASCGLSDGTITSITTGGTGVLSYSLDGVIFQAGNIFLGLAAGPYTIIVKDARGCTGNFAITVTTIGAAVTPTFAPVAAICSGAVLAPLPPTSINGITGTWSPALNNTATTTYTFTPAAGQCATTTTLTIVVSPNVIPTFNPVPAICSGAVLVPLPTTSSNGITGTWAPALNNTATTTYTFTPTSGQCATTTTLIITVNPNTTPTFTPVAPICSGSLLAPIPTTSLNGITGTWGPALNNTTTTTYTFTPTVGQCATTTTLIITVTPNITPTFTPLTPICSGSILTPLPTTSLNGITGTWAPALNNTATTTYTFTPTAGQCATTTTLTITVTPNVTPTFTPVTPICSGSILTPLPTTSLNGITGTWAPALNNTATTTYTFTPTAGQCATTTTLTITVTPNGTPTFTPVAAICSGGLLAPLPITSLNGITGTWAPSLNNTTTTTYTFTPTAGQCATTSTLTITVNPNIAPTFNPVTAICSGTVLAPLPSTSLNGITGTWAPTLNNTTTTTYTFTPTAGQCATTSTLTITVNPNILPNFNSIAAICSGTVLAPLPTTSLNGITGTWAPALNNTTTTTYTFTPIAGQCATTSTLTITVNPNILPTFNPIAAICSGDVLAPLPATSLNGITGTWAPALNNAATTTYTFTPTAGQCATTSTLTITVNPNILPNFNSIAAICSGDVLAPLPATSLNGITGTWTPALNNTTTTTYTFTPTAGQCAQAIAVTITVNPLPPSPTAIVIQPTCTLTTGTISITSVTTGLSFSIDGSTYAAYPPGGYTGIIPGPHILSAQNANGCISSATTITVNAGPAPPTAIAITVTNASCGTANGAITLGAVTGGTAPYTYSVDGSTFTSTLVYINLPAGVHIIIVKDANGCDFSASPVINNSTGATVTTVSANATCNNADGSITASGSGGVPPYQYSIDGGTTFQASNIFLNLIAGTYSVTIKDANNCITTSSQVIVNSTAGATLTAAATNSTCGNANGSIVATGTGGSLPYQYSINGGITYQVSNVFLNLPANNYTITIKDANNCTSNFSIAVVNTGGATVTASVISTSCGNNNGSVTATGTGGTGPYQYSLDGGITYQSSNIFPNLSAGIYTVTIKDANNCINSSQPVTITNSSGTSVSAIATNTSCGNNNGTITATGTGGVTPYQYSIDGVNFQPGNIFNGVAAGTYTITIKDFNNCTNTTTVTITNTNGASVSAIPANTTCGNNNGTITATGAGGVTPYQFSIDGINFQSSNIFIGVVAGTYTITIKDFNNCTNTTLVTVINTIGASVTAIPANTTCGNNNGTITATGAGGTSPYQFSVDGVNFQTSNIFNGMAAGTYTITIKDFNNCINTTSVTIANTNGPAITATATNATCGNNNGSITAAGTGGTTPYQYSIDGGATYQASPIFSNLTAGAYTVTIKDANNCSNISALTTITNSTGATVTAVATNTSCGNNNGSITVTGTGGAIPYQYSVDGINFQPSAIFNGVAAGTYIVTIRDANNCINTTSVTINNSTGALVNATAVNTTCGNNNGTITATGTGGALPYQFSINGINFQSSNIFNGVAAGTYTVTIRDANNCSNTGSITVANTSGASVTAIAANTVCGNSNGSITATGTGGALPYQYSVDGINFQPSGIFSNLVAGNYSITIRDGNNCTNSTSSIVGNTSGASVTAVPTNTSCGSNNGIITATGLGGAVPYQYSINNVNFQASGIFNGLAAGTYSITIKDANNCINNSLPITIIVSNPTTVNAGNDITLCEGDTKQITAVSNATQFSWSPSTGLSDPSILNPVASPATTTIYVLTSTTGQCSATDTITVFFNKAPKSNAGIDQSLCFGKSTQLNGSGGFTYQWSPAINLSNATIANPSLQSPAAGIWTYALSVIDANGCHSKFADSVTIIVKPPVRVFAGRDTSVTINQPLQLNATDASNSGIISYQWSPPFGLNNSFIANPIATLDRGTTYIVTGKTAEGCEGTDDIIVRVFLQPELYVPTAFTPNGDGVNDIVKVIPVGIKELKYFRIYSRWGELVFSTSNADIGWNGVYKGKEQSSYVFVWEAQGIDYKGNTISRKGTLTLIR